MNPAEIFDRTVYDSLASELGTEDTAEILNGFLADTSDKLERLSTHTPDRQTTRREVHSIKSSSATFGFLELSRLAREIEANLQEMSPDALRGAIEELRHSFMIIRRLAEAILPVDIKEIAR